MARVPYRGKKNRKAFIKSSNKVRASNLYASNSMRGGLMR